MKYLKFFENFDSLEIDLDIQEIKDIILELKEEFPYLEGEITKYKTYSMKVERPLI